MDTVLLFGTKISQAPAQLRNELEQLRIKLPPARLLIDRSERVMFKNKHLDDQILELKYSTYDAEDILRNFEDQELRQKIEAAGQSWVSQLCSSTVDIGINLIFDSSKRVRDTQDKLDKIMAEVNGMLDDTGLRDLVNKSVPFMPTTTEIIIAPEVFGRDTERDQLMEMLGVTENIDRTEKINQVIMQMGMPLTMGSTSARCKQKNSAATDRGASTRRSAKRLKGSSSCSSGLTETTNFTTGNVSVLPIFGIGGIGKTTLAQLIYNDGRVKSHFTERIWVCVSDLFDDERMTKEILKTISEPNFDLPCNMRDLRAELRKQLKSQKFLLVLDDMWEITQQWEHFYEPLRHGIEGSMILVTTRHENIARHVATNNCKPVQLEGLPDDTFWEFFKKCAFDEESPESYPALQVIGCSISKKLCGTPLAAKTLGRLLNSNLTEEHWSAINNSELWEQEQKEGDILPALRLSFLHLPYELRRCFAFCSMFPKDHSFERDKIVDIWVAEGFVAPHGTKRLEDIGICYLDTLRGRYLFQTDPKFPNQNRYVMHDLIHDTAQQASKHECFLMKDSNKVAHKFRHMSVEVDANSLSTRADIQHLNKLRSLRFVTKLNAEIAWFSQLSNILFLSLKGCMLEKLPESICELTSLRYLDISHSHVKELPAKFWCLYSLQVVDASASRVQNIDQDVTKLINLRQLALPPKASMALSRVCGLGNLACLQNLSYFTLGKQSGGICELKGMNQLRGSLCIRSIHNVKNKEEASAARLVDKKYLKKLYLYWRNGHGFGMPNSSENEVADGLCPNERIECLKIHGFGGDRLPSWFNPNDLKNLRSLELSNSRFTSLAIPRFVGGIQGGLTGQHAGSSINCINGVASIAFTHLTVISIAACRKLENLDLFLSPRSLPSVQSILISCCYSLKWIPVGNIVGFVHLQDLKLHYCSRLVCSQPSEQMVLPPSVQRLCIWGCGQLDRSFPSSWLDNLTSLTVLCLIECRNIVSITCRNKLKFLYALALASLERTIARLRSRLTWLKEGDANTKFFQQQARYRKRKNFMAKLKVGDQVIVGQEEKQEAVWDFYSNLLGVAPERSSTLNLQNFLHGSVNLSALDEFFTEEEVSAAVKSLPSDKAPGPDGYTGKFYKSCWQIIKGDIMAALSRLLQGDISKLHLLNSAYITLIPKTAEAIEVKDYRPISLVHSFAKLVTKILANRLAPYLKDLVAPNQSAFVKGRCILDNFVLVQQTARVLHRRKEPRILLKLDISKAFDSVSWAFLLQVLRHRGFGPVWCSVLSKLLFSSTTRILVNGVPGEPIQHQRGLRQGDPLSPMLFIIVMDVINALVNRASESGLLQPILASGPTQRVSLYADDVVLFLRPHTEDLILIKEILKVFGNASGLVTNISKCSVTPIHCQDQDITEVQNSFGCVVQDFPCRYLGLPLSVKKLPKAEFYHVIDKIADRLPGWKATMLHPAGRVTLVRSVLSAILIYQLMALDLPKWVIKSIDKVRRAFLWKGRKEINGGHCLVAWGRVQRPLDLGGLGILDLETMGWALRMRWLWLKKTEPDRPWATIDIQVHHNSLAMFRISVSSVVGDGTRTFFWSDRWLYGKSLHDLAPSLYEHVSRAIKGRTVRDALDNNAWVRDIRGGLSTAALIEYLQLWDILADVVLHPGVEDQHIWTPSPTGLFSTKSAYRCFFVGAVEFEPWQEIWKTWAPPRCKFFIWLAVLNRCWTADRLARRGLQHPERCPLCDQEEETVHHLLVSCVFSRTVWFAVLERVRLQEVAPGLNDTTFADWWLQAVQRIPRGCHKGFNSLVILVAWCLWKLRNGCIFDGASPILDSILRTVDEEAKLWCMAGAKGLRRIWP